MKKKKKKKKNVIWTSYPFKILNRYRHRVSTWINAIYR